MAEVFEEIYRFLESEEGRRETVLVSLKQVRTVGKLDFPPSMHDSGGADVFVCLLVRTGERRARVRWSRLELDRFDATDHVVRPERLADA